MKFMISFKDVVNAIEKAIEENPEMTISTLVILALGYIGYKHITRSDSVAITGGEPQCKICSYVQGEPLEGLKKSSEFSGNESEDEYREAVTVCVDDIPYVEEKTVYNCWSWAISPISHVVTLCNPPGIPNNHNYTIEQMRTATCIYLDAMKRSKKIENYLETFTKEDVISFIRYRDIITDKKLILGLRVSGGIISKGFDYHYIRWYKNQWTAKCGGSGIVVKNVGPCTNTIEPETMWAATLINQEPGRVRLLRDDSKEVVFKNSIYVAPTVYYLIVLP